jgi:hypothetical protein
MEVVAKAQVVDVSHRACFAHGVHLRREQVRRSARKVERMRYAVSDVLEDPRR